MRTKRMTKIPHRPKVYAKLWVITSRFVDSDILFSNLINFLMS